MELNRTVKGEFAHKLRKIYRQITGDDLPKDYNDDEVFMACLVQMMEDYYL